MESADFFAAICSSRPGSGRSRNGRMPLPVKGGLGKLRERPRGEGWRPGEPWRALARPT